MTRSAPTLPQFVRDLLASQDAPRGLVATTPSEARLTWRNSK